MTYLDALTANTYRTDSQGRRVLVPFGRWGKAYLVPAERAEELVRFQRRYLVVVTVGIVISIFVFHPLITWWVVLPLSFLGLVAKYWHFTRELEVTIEVPPRNRENARDQALRAMGSRTVAAVCIGATLLALICALLLARRVQSNALWVLMLYFLFIAALYARLWRRLRDGDRAR